MLGKLDKEQVKNQAIKNMDKVLEDYTNGLISKIPKQLNKEGRNQIFESMIINMKNLHDEDLGELMTELWTVWVDKVKNVERQKEQKQKKPVLEIPEEIKRKKVVFKEQPKEPKQRLKTDKFLYEAPKELTIEYPYKTQTKQDKFLKTHPTAKVNNTLEDAKFKTMKDKLSRPTFASYPHTWEMDHMQKGETGPYYLFIINVNTRFLIVKFTNRKDGESTRGILNELLNDGVIIKSLKFDGDKGFNSNLLINFYKQNGINWYMSNSPFTYHNKIVDASMRTMRNLLGPFSDGKLWHPKVMEQLVYYYNNTVHNTIKQTPKEFMEEVLDDIENEWKYIRKMTRELNEIEQQIQRPPNGSVVMVHLEFGEKSEKFDKRRRTYEDLAVVLDNDKNGNILIMLITRSYKYPVDVPTFAVKYVTKSFDDLLNDSVIMSTFNVTERMIQDFNEKIN